jgi:hypothetical protein
MKKLSLADCNNDVTTRILREVIDTSFEWNPEEICEQLFRVHVSNICTPSFQTCYYIVLETLNLYISRSKTCGVYGNEDCRILSIQIIATKLRIMTA